MKQIKGASMKSRRNLKTDHSGFGMVEVLIAIAIISILALGISSLVADMFRMQKKANAVAAISQMRSLIIATVQNGEAWSRTANVTDNPEMTCMTVSSPSDCTASVTGYDLNLYDAPGNPVFLARTAANGFQPNGTPCDSYPSDACPLSWDLKWVPTCPGGTPTCMTPTVSIKGTLEYNPGSDPLPGGINPDNYSINVLRGSEAIRNDPVVVVYQDNTANGEAGTCKNTWIQRQLNIVKKDDGNNLLNRPPGSTFPLTLTAPNVVNLRAGTYTCRVQVPGFKNGGNRIRIVAVSGTMFPDVNSGSFVAGLNGGSTVSTIDTTLVLPQDTTFRIEHTCTNNWADIPPPVYGHGDTAPTNDWTLGAPIGPDYTNVIYTTVSCSRTS